MLFKVIATHGSDASGSGEGMMADFLAGLGNRGPSGNGKHPLVETEQKGIGETVIPLLNSHGGDRRYKNKTHEEQISDFLTSTIKRYFSPPIDREKIDLIVKTLTGYIVKNGTTGDTSGSHTSKKVPFLLVPPERGNMTVFDYNNIVDKIILTIAQMCPLIDIYIGDKLVAGDYDAGTTAFGPSVATRSMMSFAVSQLSPSSVLPQTQRSGASKPIESRVSNKDLAKQKKEIERFEARKKEFDRSLQEIKQGSHDLFVEAGEATDYFNVLLSKPVIFKKELLSIQKELAELQKEFNDVFTLSRDLTSSLNRANKSIVEDFEDRCCDIRVGGKSVIIAKEGTLSRDIIMDEFDLAEEVKNANLEFETLILEAEIDGLKEKKADLTNRKKEFNQSCEKAMKDSENAYDEEKKAFLEMQSKVGIELLEESGEDNLKELLENLEENRYKIRAIYRKVRDLRKNGKNFEFRVLADRVFEAVPTETFVKCINLIQLETKYKQEEIQQLVSWLRSDQLDLSEEKVAEMRKTHEWLINIDNPRNVDDPHNSGVSLRDLFFSRHEAMREYLKWIVKFHRLSKNDPVQKENRNKMIKLACYFGSALDFEKDTGNQWLETLKKNTDYAELLATINEVEKDVDVWGFGEKIATYFFPIKEYLKTILDIPKEKLSESNWTQYSRYILYPLAYGSGIINGVLPPPLMSKILESAPEVEPYQKPLQLPGERSVYLPRHYDKSVPPMNIKGAKFSDEVGPFYGEIKVSSMGGVPVYSKGNGVHHLYNGQILNGTYTQKRERMGEFEFFDGELYWSNGYREGRFARGVPYNDHQFMAEGDVYTELYDDDGRLIYNAVETCEPHKPECLGPNGLKSKSFIDSDGAALIPILSTEEEALNRLNIKGLPNHESGEKRVQYQFTNALYQGNVNMKKEREGKGTMVFPTNDQEDVYFVAKFKNDWIEPKTKVYWLKPNPNGSKMARILSNHTDKEITHPETGKIFSLPRSDKIKKVEKKVVVEPVEWIHPKIDTLTSLPTGEFGEYLVDVDKGNHKQ